MKKALRGATAGSGLQEAVKYFTWNRMLMMRCLCPMPTKSSALPPTSHNVPTTEVDPNSKPTVSLLCPQRSMTSPSWAGTGTALSRRRLTLVGVGRDNESRQSPGDSELEIAVESELADGMSVADEVSEGLEEPPVADPLPTPPFPRAVIRGMESLDDIDLWVVFASRRHEDSSNVGGALRFEHDEPRQDRAWKLFMLLPRMLLQRPSRGGVVTKWQIQASQTFATRVRENMVSAEQGSEAMRRKRKCEGDNLVKRAARASGTSSIGKC